MARVTVDWRHYAALALLCATAAAVVVIAHPRAPRGTGPAAGLPARIGAWEETQEIAYDSRVLAILGTKDVTGRVYRGPRGQKVKLVMVRAVNNRSAFHPPEYCLRGAGYDIVGKRRTAFELGGRPFGVNEMLFSGDRRQLLVWNWYAAGAAMTPNFYAQQLRLLADQVRRGAGEGTMVTLYADTGEGEMEARQANEDFARALIPLLATLREGADERK